MINCFLNLTQILDVIEEFGMVDFLNLTPTPLQRRGARMIV
jgi:hypothetical protein